MQRFIKNNNSSIKVARISSISFFLETQLKQQLIDIKNSGYEVTIISSKGDGLSYFEENNIEYINIEIERNISIFKDLMSLIKLYRVFRNNSFDILHSTTPKAGLLVSIAGFLAASPIRLHTFTGQVWKNSKGLKRTILKLADKIIVKLNTHCYADGFSQVYFLKEQGVISSVDSIKVFGEGSLSGVNLKRFDISIWGPKKKELLKKYGIDNSNLKIIFVGRITFDKGIVDLIKSFSLLIKRSRNYDLILLGPIENQSNLISQDILDKIKNSKNIYHYDYSSSPETFYTMGDIFCLPSHREGFGTTVIEAAAMGLATVGTNIYGLNESIIHNKTGILVPPRDSLALANAIEEMLEDKNKRKFMSKLAFERVQDSYDSELVSKFIMDEYTRLVDNMIHSNQG